VTLAERNAQRAEQTRDRALAQGLARFPPDGGGPVGPDRYILPDAFTLAEWRLVRLAPVSARMPS